MSAAFTSVVMTSSLVSPTDASDAANSTPVTFSSTATSRTPPPPPPPQPPLALPTSIYGENCSELKICNRRWIRSRAAPIPLLSLLGSRNCSHYRSEAHPLIRSLPHHPFIRERQLSSQIPRPRSSFILYFYRDLPIIFLGYVVVVVVVVVVAVVVVVVVLLL